MDLIKDLGSPITFLVVVLLIVIYRWIARNNDYFLKRGIPHKKPNFLFGHMRKLVLAKCSFNDFIIDTYTHFPEEKVIGIYELMNPITMIRDPELIKQIGVKDFDHFVNHRTPLEDSADRLFTKNLFSMKGDKWRDMRSTLSPAFTGSKMRSMFELVVNCAEDMKSFLVEQSDKEKVVVEMKDLFTRFANDVIATSAFGIQVNSLKDPQNEFYTMGHKVTDFSGLQSLKFFGFTNAPKLMRALGISLFNEKVQNFFRRSVMGNIAYREEHNIYRPDMIQLLMQARKGKLTHSTNEAAGEKADTSDTFAVVQEANENILKPSSANTKRGQIREFGCIAVKLFQMWLLNFRVGGRRPDSAMLDLLLRGI